MEEDEEEEEEEEDDEEPDDEKSDKDYSTMSNFPDNDALNKIKWPTDVSKSNFRSFMSTVSAYLINFSLSKT